MADEPTLALPSVPTMVDDKDERENKDPNQEQEPKLATVKMLLQTIGQTATVAFPLRSPISDLVAYFAKELRMPANVLQITFKGKGAVGVVSEIDTILSD